MLDPAGCVASWNPGAARFTGYGASEILGQNFARFYTIEDRASGEPQQTLDTAAREGRFETQAWRVRRDGSCFRAGVVVESIRGQTGALMGFAEVIRVLAEMKPSTNLVRQMIEAAPTAAMVAHAAGRIVMVNGRTEQLFGYPSGELLGSSVELVLPSGSQALFTPPSARPIGAGHVLCGRTRDGKQVRVEVGMGVRSRPARASWCSR